jgi:tetratricopeptide (TPR) repeat protein
MKIPKRRRHRRWRKRNTWLWSIRLEASILLGRGIGWLSRGGRLALLSLVPVAIALVSFKVAWWKVLLGYCIFLVIWAASRAHVRVVIEGFDDYSSLDQAAVEDHDGAAGARDRKDGEAPKNAGAAVLLANRLAQMRELYGFVDDPDMTPTPGRATGATVQLDDAASVLRSAVTTESTVSVGGISLPFGALMGAISRVVQAPRLRGAIHGDATALVVTAELTVEAQPYAWHIAADVEGGITPHRQLERMISDELAYQVFSDLTLQRQAMWPATKFWLVALGKMAECQRRPRNRRLLLKEAELNFASALAEDERFYLACLNLGIVYRRLASYPTQLPEQALRYTLAARRVFERAIELRPDRWEAYHALAEANWSANRPENRSEGSLEMIVGLCDRALSRCSDRADAARILDLKGHAQEAAGAKRDALDTRRRACGCILRELEWTRLRQARTRQARRLDTLEKQAAQCLVNLAWTSWQIREDRASFRRAYGAAKLAVRLSDIDARAHERLAEMAHRIGKMGVVVDELSAAARIAPAEPLYAAKLAVALAETGDSARAEEACKRAERLTDFGLKQHGVAQAAVIEAYRKVGDSEWAEQLEKRRELTKDLTRIKEGGSSDPVAALRALLSSLEAERDWEAARVQTELGRAMRDAKDGSPEFAREADRCFTEALTWFKAHYPHDNRVAELHSDRALALASQRDRSGEALAEAETAVTLDPLRSSYREVLSRVHEAGGDLDGACEAADRALLLDPDDPNLHFRLASLKWRRAESIADPDVHNRERRDAARQFEEALKLYEPSQRDERRKTHWWLAMSYFAMSDFSDVPAHLSFVLSSIEPGNSVEIEHRGLEATAELWLGMAYRKLQKFTDAERHLSTAIRVASGLADAGVPSQQCLTGAFGDDRWPLGIVKSLAHLQRAGCHADRGGALDRAKKDLNTARETLEAMEDRKDLAEIVEDGWSDYLAESGRVLLADGDPEEAVEALRRSAELDPGEADVYLLLARAHARIAARQLGEDWQQHIGLGLDACRRTWEIAGDGHPDTLAATEVEEQLRHIATATAPATDVPSKEEGEAKEERRSGWEWQGGGRRFPFQAPDKGPTPGSHRPGTRS